MSTYLCNSSIYYSSYRKSKMITTSSYCLTYEPTGESFNVFSSYLTTPKVYGWSMLTLNAVDCVYVITGRTKPNTIKWLFTVSLLGQFVDLESVSSVRENRHLYLLDCCSSDLNLHKFNSARLSNIKKTSLSFHPKVTLFGHDIAE